MIEMLRVGNKVTFIRGDFLIESKLKAIFCVNVYILFNVINNDSITPFKYKIIMASAKKRYGIIVLPPH